LATAAGPGRAVRPAGLPAGPAVDPIGPARR